MTNPPETAKHASGSVTIEADVARRVNFASAQNDVPVIRRLALRNDGIEAIRDVTLHMRAEPAILRERVWTLDRLAPGTTTGLADLALLPDLSRLSGLDEAETAMLSLELRMGDELLCREEIRVELLARDEWGGLGEMAQLLPAFISPNEPAVAALLREASRLLETSRHDGAIDGYQSGDPGRAWMLAGAIWSAATALGLTYAVPPASFEAAGQKIRGPARIRSEGLATCLDTALLLAAAFEAAGLNPAVLFSQGHAWVGVWLTPRDFGQVVEPDVVSVRKAIAAREFVPIETVLLCRRPSTGFEQAVEEGRRRLSEERETEFLAAIDVARSRAARIRPMASHRSEADQDDDMAEAVAAALPRPLDPALLPVDFVERMPATPQGRVERWQRQLLDLSLRNRLLNYRDSRGSVPFLCPDVAALEDRLADGGRVAPLALDEDDRTRLDLPKDERRRVTEALAADALERGQIAAPLTGREMQSRLLTLYRKSRSDMQEGGTNTLFLAAGFLRWKRPEDDSRIYRAPILLIPVRLDRRSAQSDFRLLHHEDEVRINATLLEFLKRDFDLSMPGLDGELPRDESGIDVPRIFELMRLHVRDVPGFEVVEDLALSTFSFAKYLMWKDLVDRTDQLRDSPLVQHLLDNPDQGFAGLDLPTLAPEDLDRELAPSDLLTPLPADSSQLAAVAAAAQGQDFVLIGPPGTGKSQTIANIVAQCLSQGRTVLFVAEKAAALDVVHRRLAAHGLADACLELHSNKTDRKSVLAQLGRSWERAARDDGEEWIAVTDELRLTRDQLNAYAVALHRRGTQGFSVFEAIARVAGSDARLRLSFASKDAHDAESYGRLKALAAELGRLHEIVGQGPRLDLVAASDWSFAWEDRFITAAESLAAATRDLDRALGTVLARFGLRRPTDARGGDLLHLLCTLGPLVAEDAPSLERLPDLPVETLERYRDELVESQEAYEAVRDRLAAEYAEDGLDRVPVASLDADWRLAQAKIWPFSVMAKRRVRLLLQSYASGGRADPSTDLDALQRLILIRARLFENPLAEGAIPPGKGQVRALDAALGGLALLRDVFGRLGAETDDASVLGRARAELVSGRDGPVRDALAGLLAASDAFDAACREFEHVGGIVRSDLAPRALGNALTDLLAHQARIADWTRWMAACDKAKASGLAPLVAALEGGRLDRPADEAFETAYAKWWLPRAMDAEPVLRGFAHWAHDDLVARFRALDDRAAQLAPSEVLRRIGHGLPDRDTVPRNSELGVLRHQLGLRRPSMPIRKLMSEMPGSLPRLAPCVLMSPLSVAQYLPAGQPAFDVVIFDEASQITTWDAIGSIARGRQSIIVGDPKQLPPTNFFGRSEDDDEDIPEMLRDMPSILDEVSAAGIPTRRLNWHYRSRDEALIAFSNHHYYDGGLVTFPSPGTGGEALQLHRVDGRYARGKGRTNREEAQAIVAMIRGRLTDWLRRPEAARPTLGVITFNGDQQALILDMLDAMRRDAPELEWFFSEDREEPLIVKNLENIQGDERDVMLFSVTFGPDLAGKLSMNFGALNGEGGERRLNVAITRARREMHVFASLDADQIDLGRSRARGVADLKAFLDYAARGAVALPARVEGSQGPAENPFEEAVAAALEAKGWEVRTQIGVSGYRIDLAVVHPDRAGAYLAGVECDGARYHSSATARDRDKTRQAVLEGLGWSILRVWSTDWFRSPSDVAARTDARLCDLLAADRAKQDSARAAHAKSERLSLPAPGA